MIVYDFLPRPVKSFRGCEKGLKILWTVFFAPAN